MQRVQSCFCKLQPCEFVCTFRPTPRSGAQITLPSASMATAASLTWSSPLHVQSLLRIRGEERLPGTCLTCIANGNAARQGESRRPIDSSLGLKNRLPARSSCWQSSKERRKSRGEDLCAWFYRTFEKKHHLDASPRTAAVPAFPGAFEKRNTEGTPEEYDRRTENESEPMKYVCLMAGDVLRAAADSEADSVEAQDIPQAASPDSFLSYEEAGLVEFATNLDMHERFLARLTISSLNLLRVISKQEGVPIEELNAGRVVDWFVKDKEKRKEDVNSAVLKWPSMPDDDFQNSIW